MKRLHTQRPRRKTRFELITESLGKGHKPARHCGKEPHLTSNPSEKMPWDLDRSFPIPFVLQITMAARMGMASKELRTDLAGPLKTGVRK